LVEDWVVPAGLGVGFVFPAGSGYGRTESETLSGQPARTPALRAVLSS
jgi:hypothetical protein